VPPPQALHVMHGARGWEVHADGDVAPLSRHDGKADAVALALLLSRRSGATVVLHDETGHVTELEASLRWAG
jgi:hypothetical protein